MPIKNLRSFFHAFLRTSTRQGARRGLWSPGIQMESLETRTLLSTVIWDGGGATANWSDRFNWQGDVAPINGDSLVFPANAARLTNFDNFPSGTNFNSITFSGTGYNISGGSFNVLSLGTGGIINSATSGTNAFFAAIQFDGARTIDVAAGGDLVLAGALSGVGAFSKVDGGQLTLAGTDANTFSGTALVTGGLLALNKAAGNAIAGSGLLISAGSAFADVDVEQSNQIGDTTPVTLSGDHAFFEYPNNFTSETIGPLTMTGGHLEVFSDQGPALTVNGNLTAQPVLNPLISPTPASPEIQGDFSFTSGTKTLTVNALAGFPNVPGLLMDDGTLAGSNVVKQGNGTWLDDDTTQLNQLDVNAGGLIVHAKLTSTNPITVRNDATLGGSGTINGTVNMQTGFSQFLDDGGAGFTAPGWTFVTGHGVAGHLVQAAPWTPTIPPSNPLTATWTFSGLSPGLYRVFATWTGGASHTTDAAYTIFDNTTLESTTTVNQEVASAGGPTTSTLAFQQLGDLVNITSGTLKVALSNKVVQEMDDANVIADAVRIEKVGGTISPLSQHFLSIADPTTPGTLTINGNLNMGPGSTYLVNLASTSPGVNTADQIAAGGFSPNSPLLALASDTFSPPTPGTAYRILVPGQSQFFNGFSNAPHTNDTIQLLSGGQRHTFSINYGAGDGNDIDLIYQNTATQVKDLKLSPQTINGHGGVMLHGALTDPNVGDTLSLQVDWGDGEVETFTDLGTKPFHFAHTYADTGAAPFVIHVNWFDQHGAGNSAKFVVTVGNARAGVEAGTDPVQSSTDIQAAQAGVFDTNVTAVPTEDADASSPRPFLIGSHKALQFSNENLSPRKAHETPVVLDDDGGLGVDTFLVRVLG